MVRPDDRWAITWLSSHGRPYDPRPIITPSAPDCSSAASASSGEQKSPLTITGTFTACLTERTQRHSASPLYILFPGACFMSGIIGVPAAPLVTLRYGHAMLMLSFAGPLFSASLAASPISHC